MKPKHVLAMISPMSAERVSGIARYAKEHGWNLMIQDRLGHTPLAWNGDGILVTLRSDAVTFKSISALMRRSIPLVDLTYDDTDAARLLYAAKELGVNVPEELAILSIGNNPLVCENQSVPLSSIDQNLELGGYEAAALLDRLMSSSQNNHPIRQSGNRTIEQSEQSNNSHSSQRSRHPAFDRRHRRLRHNRPTGAQVHRREPWQAHRLAADRQRARRETHRTGRSIPHASRSFCRRGNQAPAFRARQVAS